MDPKPRPNHQLYLDALRRLTPEQRLLKAFELTELSRELFRAGLRQRFPEASEAELQRIYLERLEKCHNRPS
jgi:Rv0078B-related antitoxin